MSVRLRACGNGGCVPDGEPAGAEDEHKATADDVAQASEEQQ